MYISHVTGKIILFNFFLIGKNVKHIFLISAFVFSLSSLASENSVNINGFGTMSYVRSNSDILYNDGIENKNNYNYDTKAGVTLNKFFSNEWEFAMQFMAQPDERGSIQPKVNILQVVYRPSSELSFRIGRFRLPLWMISEYLDVGVLIPWIRPPDEVYSSLPIEELNGVNANYTFDVASSIFNLDVFTGAGAIVTNGGTAITGTLDNVLGTSLSVAYDFLTIRASYVQGTFSSSTLSKNYIPGGSGPCVGVPPSSSCEITTETDLNLGNSYFTSLGLKSEWRNTLFMGEYASWKTSSDLIKESQAFYVLGGYYFLRKKLLTHFTMSRSTKVESLLSVYQGRQKSLIYGANYSVNQNVMFKLDFREVSTQGMGLFAKDLKGDKVHIWGVGVDFVF